MTGSDGSGSNAWVARGWVLAERDGHPLHALHGQRMGDVSAQVLLGPSNRFGARYFQVFAVDDEGRTSDQPALLGLHSTGRYPSYNWVEVMALAERLTFASSAEQSGRVVEMHGSGLERELLKRLADVIPLGGHMMMEYDSPGQRETAQALGLGIPPAATPLGYLLYSIGSGISFRDWYFAEGGSEGPRKLQGYKPLHAEHARERGRQLARQLIEFLERRRKTGHADVQERARQRAVDILASIELDDGDLKQEVRRVLAAQ